MTSDKKYPQSS